MTENKRFKYCFEGIEDKWETVEEYKYTPCTKDGFQDLCVMLNDLNDENEELKLLTNYRGEMVSFATSIIQDMGSEEMLKMWNDFTEVMYQKWKKKRGIK